MNLPRAMSVGIMNPLQLPISKAVLLELLQGTITTLQQSMQLTCLPDDRFELELMLSQRIEFQQFVTDYPDSQVPIALYTLDANPEFIGLTTQLH